MSSQKGDFVSVLCDGKIVNLYYERKGNFSRNLVPSQKGNKKSLTKEIILMPV